MGACLDMNPCSFKAPRGSCCQIIMRAVVEFLGTFFLVHAVCLIVNQSVIQAAFAAGLALMVLVYTFGHISGGHFNPAVSTCQWIAGQITFITWVTFVVSQIVGGIVGGLIASQIAVAGPFPVFNADQHEEGLWIEFLFTWLLCTTVANTATTTFLGYEDNSFFGFAIGMVVAVGGFMSKSTLGIGSSSGAFNPAVLLGCNIASVVFDDRNLGFAIPSAPAEYWVAFLGIEFLAAICAGLFFLLTESTVIDNSGKSKYSDDEGTTDGDSSNYDKPTDGYEQPAPNNYGNQPAPNNYGNQPQPSGGYGNQPQPRGYSDQPQMMAQTIEMAM